MTWCSVTTLAEQAQSLHAHVCVCSFHVLFVSLATYYIYALRSRSLRFFAVQHFACSSRSHYFSHLFCNKILSVRAL